MAMIAICQVCDGIGILDGEECQMCYGVGYFDEPEEKPKMEIQVLTRKKCTRCDDGIIDDPHCQYCGERIPSGHVWWGNPDDQMPCGHSARKHLCEEYICFRCEGDGYIEKWIDFSELVRIVKDG